MSNPTPSDPKLNTRRDSAVVVRPWNPLDGPTLRTRTPSRGATLVTPQVIFIAPVEKACSVCLPLQETHHRIANHFALLNSFVRLRTSDIAHQAHEPNRIQMLTLLDVISVQISTLAKFHRMLATAGSSRKIDIGEHLHDCLSPFKSGLYGNIAFTEDFAVGCFAEPEQLLTISQIVAEVVTNSIKYGRPVNSAITVACSNLSDGLVLIEVSDNGPGLPEGFDTHTSGGMGFRILRALSETLGASIAFQSTNDGVHFRLFLQAANFAAEDQAISQILSDETV